VADTQWASGDRGSAQRAYKDIEDRFPEGTYPGYVKTRAGGGAAPAPSSAPAATGATSPTTTGAPKPASSEQDGL
jgi:hypothetical protein